MTGVLISWTLTRIGAMNRLLIAGYGDIARRLAALLSPDVEVRGLSRGRGHDLDLPETIADIAGWADSVLHLAPPPGAGAADTRTANLLTALDSQGILAGAAKLPQRIVYASTSGVYGDCGGARIDEDRPTAPLTARARRRVDAEQQLARWCSVRGVALVVLRVPGIYAADRLPVQRLRDLVPVLREEDDVYTNHIHAEDLARIALRALEPAAPPGTYNASDDSELKMGDWFDLLADRLGLPRPPRIARAEADGRIPAASLSFMSESRRLVNRRMKQQLGVSLRYPTVREGLNSPGRAPGAP